MPQGLKGNTVRYPLGEQPSRDRNRGCPRNCERRAFIRQTPLGDPREGRMMVKTREPGDLPHIVAHPTERGASAVRTLPNVVTLRFWTVRQESGFRLTLSGLQMS